jgi:hypothetical protein
MELRSQNSELRTQESEFRSQITPYPTGRLIWRSLSQALRARLRSHSCSGTFGGYRSSGGGAEFFLLTPEFCLLNSAPSQSQILLGIFIADPADQVGKQSLVIRDLTPFHFHAQQVTEKAAEIFMTGIGHEAS